MTVTAVLVSHAGARWLPSVLAGLEAQSVPPDRCVAVDTGSEDRSVDLLRDALGEQAVVLAGPSTSFGAAVAAAVRSAEPAAGEWLWLLHDDAAPAPDALERLLRARDSHPGGSAFGPKLRAWPPATQLLEVGVTISGSGRRVTGLDSGERDQGQHDLSRRVLAVSTVGMLVRRADLERLGGFDPRLAALGGDLDLGWRMARAGLSTWVAPDAVVFHAQATRRGLRPVGRGRPSPRRAEREAVLYTLLVNCAALVLPVQLLRLPLGGALRMLGLVLWGEPRFALDEAAALLHTYARPRRVVRGRRERAASASVPAREVRPLLPPVWAPYRHGVERVAEAAAALWGRRGGAGGGTTHDESGPVPHEAQDLPGDTGLTARLATTPVGPTLVVLTLLGAWSARHVLGDGLLAGGALLPAPGGAVDWWATYLRGTHDLGTGSGAPAPPYLLPLAVGASVLLGKAWLLVDLVFFLVVPLAAWSAYRLLRDLVGHPLPALWGAVAYGLLPVLSGSVDQGRLGTVVGAALLPAVARAARGMWVRAEGRSTWPAAWRTGLWLALLTAFAPLAWVLAVLLLVPAAVVGSVTRRAPPRSWAPPLTSVALVPLLLVPWTIQVFTSGNPASLLLEAGLPDALPAHLSTVGVSLARAGPAGAPAWLSAGVTLAGVAALLRRSTRHRVLVAWGVLTVATVLVALAGGLRLHLPGLTGQFPPWPGIVLLVVHGSLVTAAVLAADGARAEFARASFGWRQPVAGVVVLAAALSPLAGLVWWSTHGVSEPLSRPDPEAALPAYMTQGGDAGPGVLVLQRGRGGGVGYSLARAGPLRLGQAAVLAATPPDPGLRRLVDRLVTQPAPAQVRRLARYDVGFVYLPPPAVPGVAGALDGVAGLSRASAARPGARAWRLDPAPSSTSLESPDAGARPWLLGLQLLALVTCLVRAVATPESPR